MTEKLEFVKGYDFQSDQGTVSLLDYTDGFNVAYEGWVPRNRADRDGRVRETITVRVEGTSTNDLIANLQKLAEKAEETKRYFSHDAKEYAIWFRAQMEGESNTRQSLIYDIQHQAASSIYDYSVRQRYHLNDYVIGIERAPWWEDLTPGTISGTPNASGSAFTFGTIQGDLPARIAEVKIDNVGTTSTWWTWPFGRAWVGFKTERYAPAGSFVPYWSLGAPPDPYAGDDMSGIITGDDTVATDTTTIGGTRVVFEYFSGNAGLQRFVRGLVTSAVTTKSDHLWGDYLVLLRARLSTYGTVLVQMKTAFDYDSYLESEIDTGSRIFPNARVYPQVPITATLTNYGTAWHFYELGRISIPPSSHSYSQQDIRRWGMMLYAKNEGGTPHLYLDGFVLVPLEGFVFVGAPGATYKGANAQTANAFLVNSPEGIVQAYSQGGNLGIPTWNEAVVIANLSCLVEGGVPVGSGGEIYVVADNNFGHLKNAKSAVTIKYYERWKEARGAE